MRLDVGSGRKQVAHWKGGLERLNQGLFTKACAGLTEPKGESPGERMRQLGREGAGE